MHMKIFDCEAVAWWAGVGCGGEGMGSTPSLVCMVPSKMSEPEGAICCSLSVLLL